MGNARAKVRVHQVYVKLVGVAAMHVNICVARLAMRRKPDHKAVCHKLLVCGLTNYRWSFSVSRN